MIIEQITGTLFAVVLVALFFGVVYALACLGDRAERGTRTIRCRCGSCVARNVIIVDRVDEQRLRDALSENCPGCRSLPEPKTDARSAKGRSDVERSATVPAL